MDRLCVELALNCLQVKLLTHSTEILYAVNVVLKLWKIAVGFSIVKKEMHFLKNKTCKCCH